MFAIRKKEDEKWGQIKKGFIDQITGKYNNILAKKIKPKISITERIKTDKDENQLLLLFIEVWLKKDEAKAIKFDFIEHLISQEAEILSIENYQRQKFHVEQETK